MFSISRALIGAATVLICSAAGPLAAQTAPAGGRFAYVDTRLILESAPGRVEAEATLQKEQAVWQAEVNKMQEDNVKLTSDFQKTSAAMTTAVRDKKIKDISDQQALWQKRSDDINAEAQRRQAEVLQPILDQIKLALEDVRSANKLDAIFDIGQNATIVAVDKNLNYSDRVIARLRQMGPPVQVKATDAPKAGAPAAKPSGLPVASPAGIGKPPIKPDSTPVKKPE